MSNAVHLDLRAPTVADGPMLRRMATDSVALDVNPPCAYLLWCRDFSAASVIAPVGGHRWFVSCPGETPARVHRPSQFRAGVIFG